MDLFDDKFSLVTLDYAQNESGIRATDILFMLNFTQNNAYPGQKINCIIENNTIFFTPSEVSLLANKFEEFRIWYDINYDELGRARNSPNIDDDFDEFARENIYENNIEEDTENTESEESHDEEASETDDSVVDNLLPNKEEKKNKAKPKNKKTENVSFYKTKEFDSYSNRKKMEELYVYSVTLGEQKNNLEKELAVAKSSGDESRIYEIKQDIKNVDSERKEITDYTTELSKKSKLTGNKEKEYFEENVKMFQEASEKAKKEEEKLERLRTELEDTINLLNRDANHVVFTEVEKLKSLGNVPNEVEVLNLSQLDVPANLHYGDFAINPEKIPENIPEINKYTSDNFDNDALYPNIKQQKQENVVNEEFVKEKFISYDKENDDNSFKNIVTDKYVDDSRKQDFEHVKDYAPKITDKDIEKTTESSRNSNSDVSGVFVENKIKRIKNDDFNQINSDASSATPTITKQLTDVERDALFKKVGELSQELNTTLDEYKKYNIVKQNAADRIAVFDLQNSTVKEGTSYNDEHSVRKLETIKCNSNYTRELETKMYSIVVASENCVALATAKYAISKDMHNMGDALKSIMESEHYSDVEKKEKSDVVFGNIANSVNEQLGKYNSFVNTIYMTPAELNAANITGRTVTVQTFLNVNKVAEDAVRSAEIDVNNAFYQTKIKQATANNESIETLVDQSNRDTNKINQKFAEREIYYNDKILAIANNVGLRNTDIEMINNAVALMAPSNVALDIVEKFNETNIKNNIKNELAIQEYRENAVTSLFEKSFSISNEHEMYTVKRAINAINTSNYCLNILEQHENNIKTSFSENREKYIALLEKDQTLSLEEKQIKLDDYNKRLKETLTETLTTLENNKFNAKRTILDNSLTIALQRVKDKNSPQGKAEIADINIKFSKESDALNDEHLKNIKNINKNINALLSIREKQNKTKVLGDASTLVDFDMFSEDDMVSEDELRQNDNEDDSISLSLGDEDATNDGTNKVDESAHIISDNAIDVLTEKDAKNDVSNDLLNEAQLKNLNKSLDWHWATLDRLAQSTGKISLNSLKSATRNMMWGTDIHSGFRSVAPIVGVPTTILVTTSLRYTINLRRRDVDALFGSAQNRDALEKLFISHGFRNINMRNIKTSDLDNLFKADTKGFKKFSELSPAQLKKMLKSADITDAQKGAIYQLMFIRKEGKMKSTLGRYKGKSSSYRRRFMNIFFNGTEAGEGFEDLQRLYRYAHQTFSASYKTARFFGRHLGNFNTWARKKQMRKALDNIKKGKNVVRNEKRFNRLKKTHKRVVKRKKTFRNVSNKLAHFQNNYTLGGLKRKVAQKAVDAFMKKFGETAVVKALGAVAGKVAAAVSSLLTYGLYALLILIAIFLFITLLAMVLKMFEAPIGAAASRIDSGEPLFVQGYHKLYLNQDGYDPLNKAWHDAIAGKIEDETQTIFGAKKPDDNNGFINPADGKNFKIDAYGKDGISGYSSFYTSDGYGIDILSTDYPHFYTSNAKLLLTMADTKITNTENGANWNSIKYAEYLAKLFEETHYCSTVDGPLEACSYGCTAYHCYCFDKECDDYISGAYFMSSDRPKYNNSGYSCTPFPYGTTYCDGCLKFDSVLLGKKVKYCPGHPYNVDDSNVGLIDDKTIPQNFQHSIEFNDFDVSKTAFALLDAFDDYLYYDGILNHPAFLGGCYNQKTTTDCDGNIQESYSAYSNLIKDNSAFSLTKMADAEGIFYLIGPYTENPNTAETNMQVIKNCLYHSVGEGANEVAFKCDSPHSFNFLSDSEWEMVYVSKNLYNYKTFKYVTVKFAIMVPKTTDFPCTHIVTEVFQGNYYSYCPGHSYTICVGHKQLYAAGVISFAQDNLNSIESTKNEKDKDTTLNAYINVNKYVESDYWDNSNVLDWLHESDGSYLFVDLVRAKMKCVCDKCSAELLDYAYCPNGCMTSACPVCGKAGLLDSSDIRFCTTVGCDNFFNSYEERPYVVLDNWNYFSSEKDGIEINAPSVRVNYGERIDQAYKVTINGTTEYVKFGNFKKCRVNGKFSSNYTVNIESLWNEAITPDFTYEG